MLHYNENKVANGDARLLLANAFAGDAAQFSLEEKLKRFEHLTMLNSRVKTIAVHISLNFDPQDKLSAGQLQQISIDYMEHIGFGDQPYLVYQHTDAAHTHVHIATVNIQNDGSRIDTHGIGWRLSEPARQELEKEFGLTIAKGRNRSNELGIKPADVAKAVYGKTPTKRTITNIVNAVIRDYKFTSLAEFNAVLRAFNVQADRGGEQTLMREKGGLVYSLINAKGEAVGIPIKASAIYNQPTLKNLQAAFERGKIKREPLRQPLKDSIERVFKACSNITKNTFIAELQKRNIQVLFRTNEQGYTYGVTFIDHHNKTVFNGSDLGKAYGAKALLERFGAGDKLIHQPRQQLTKPNTIRSSNETTTGTHNKLSIALARYQAQAAPSVTKPKKKRRQQNNDLTL